MPSRARSVPLVLLLTLATCSDAAPESEPEPEPIEPARIVGAWAFTGYQCDEGGAYADPMYAWSFTFDGDRAVFTWDYADGCRHVVSDVTLGDVESGQYFGYSSDAIVCTPDACAAQFTLRRTDSNSSVPTNVACESGTHGSGQLWALEDGDTRLLIRQYTSDTLFGDCSAVFERVTP